MDNNYIIVGDSITYGIGDYEYCGWATMFKKHILSKDDSKVCHNYVHIAAFPGDTSRNILEKIDNIIKSFKKDEYTNKVILSIGVNDTQEFNGNQKCSIEEFKDNIKNIIKCSINNDCQVIILGLTRIESNKRFFWKTSKYYDNSVIEKYDAELEKLFEEDDYVKELMQNGMVGLLPMKNVLKKEDFIDGLHPNTNGHSKIFEFVKNYIVNN